jgi:hypothetical protein
MKSRRSWLVIAGLVLALGAYAAYYGFLYDWRGRFAPDQLSLSAQVSGPELHVTLRNCGPTNVMVFYGPGLAGPFDLGLTPAGGGPELPAARPSEATGGPCVLEQGRECSWSVPLRTLFPNAPSGNYVLSVAYDPAGAAERGAPCAAELTLGRTEAPPVEVRIPPGR